MQIKTFRSAMQFKAEGEEGDFTAIFSTLNVIDHDGDVTLPGAFTEGEKVRISYWGHRWRDLPVGRGEIHSDEEKAWVDGKFFLDTEHGMQTYLTVKNLGELQEWSYGFDIDEVSFGEFEDQDVAFLLDDACGTRSGRAGSDKAACGRGAGKRRIRSGHGLSGADTIQA